VPRTGHDVSFRGADNSAIARELMVHAPALAELPRQQILRVEFLDHEPLGRHRGLPGGEQLREALIEVRGKLFDNFGFTRASEVELGQARADGGRPIRHIPLS
jgi:hypothetical protein